MVVKMNLFDEATFPENSQVRIYNEVDSKRV